MTANLTITIDERNNVLKVPNSALRFTPTDASAKGLGVGLAATAPEVQVGRDQVGRDVASAMKPPAVKARAEIRAALRVVSGSLLQRVLRYSRDKRGESG